jgi:streptomycin 6-kinase
VSESSPIVPQNLTRSAHQRGRGPWIDALPDALARACQLFSLDWVGAPFEPGGQTAWVAPVHGTSFGDAVLKITARHDESRDEAAGLRVWDGAGAVRLLADERLDEHTEILLLERCRPGGWLAEQAAEVQDEVISALLERLWREPPQEVRFRPLADMCDRWAAAAEGWAERQAMRLDSGLVCAGIELFRALAREPGRRVLLCTDLHAENVLSAQREPWLMIDPKPYLGDPCYDVLQHIINAAARWGRDPGDLARRMSDRLGLDAARVRLWVYARCVVGAADWPELIDVARVITPT